MIVDLREGIDLIGGEDPDRHVWMSPNLVKKQASKIAEIFSRQFPEHRREFEARYQSLIIELDALDSEIRLALDPVKNSVMLVSHPAFGYFCRDYSLQQLSVEFEGKDPRPKYLEFVLKQKRPDVAISLPQHNNKGVIVVAEKFQVPIQMIDPYSYHYFETMRALTKWIRSPYDQSRH